MWKNCHDRYISVILVDSETPDSMLVWMVSEGLLTPCKPTSNLILDAYIWSRGETIQNVILMHKLIRIYSVFRHLFCIPLHICNSELEVTRTVPPLDPVQLFLRTLGDSIQSLLRLNLYIQLSYKFPSVFDCEQKYTRRHFSRKPNAPFPTGNAS